MSSAPVPAHPAASLPVSADRLRIVLVGTQHPGNIGSAARAMKTMGFSRLVLVAPERFPHPEAEALAAGAVDVLEAAVQVLAYELRVGWFEPSVPSVRETAALADASVVDAREAATRSEPPATHAELEGFFSQLAETLDAIDFHKGRTPAAAMRKFRRLFLRAGLDAREVRLLRGMLADAQRMADIAEGRIAPPRRT